MNQSHPASGSFRSFAREALLPSTTFGRVVLALVALRTPVVWLTAWLTRGEPFVVTAMYRPGGDVQYFELVGAFGRGNLGESNIFELAGQGLHPFPLGSIWLHSLLFGVAGAWGFFLADCIATVCGYVALVLLARACTLSARGAAAFGGFVCGYVYVAFTPLTDRFGWMRDLFWGDRFPRPLLTEIYVVLSFAALVRVWLSRRDAPREGGASAEPPPLGAPFWVFAGLAFSSLVQSDIYGAFIVGLAYTAVLGHRLLTVAERRAETLRGVGVMALVVAATAWPFALQRRASTAELLARWGYYPLPRPTALSWVARTPLAAPLLVAAAAGAVWWWARRAEPSRAEARTSARIAAFWGLVMAMAVVAFPLFFAILGHGFYPYMFPDRQRRVAMWSLAFIVLPAVVAWWQTSAPARRPWILKALAGALLAAMVFGIGVRTVEAMRKEDHVRTWYKYGPGVKYRTSFAELVRELEKPDYKDVVVLGTLDQQVHVHWQTFVGRRSFVPDGFTSIAPDAEAERRFAYFCRTVGVPTDEYLSLFGDSRHNGLLFVSKYSANSAYALAPLSDYSEAQRESIARRDPFVSFAFEVPRSEQDRLRRLYEDPALSQWSPRLDLIVLNNEGRYGKQAPAESGWALVFRNAVFRVFAPKRDAH